MLDHLPDEARLRSDNLSCEIVSGIAATDPSFWTRALPDDPEGYSYQAACEAAGRGAFALNAAVVKDGARTVAICPLFQVSYRLDTSLQGTARRFSEVVSKVIPGASHMNLIGFGSPYADTCAIGFDPELDADGVRKATAVLIDGVLAYGASKKIKLFAIKDLSQAREGIISDVLREKRFSRMSGLPNCALDLPYQNTDGYFATLSRITRKDIRRKLRSAGEIRIERRVGITDIAGEIRSLYEATRGASAFDYNDFETLPEFYFDSVARGLGQDAVFMLYWVDGQLAAFNLLLVNKDRAVDKFLGMRRDLAETHNLYAVSWIENIRFCIERKIRTLQLGPTAYSLKLRFGSRLEPSGIWFRHTGPILNSLFRSVAPLVAFDKLDPELSEWRKRKAGEAKDEAAD